jgi:integrase
MQLKPKKWRRSGGATKPKKSARLAVDDTRFWKTRLFHPGYTRNGQRVEQPEFAVRMQKGGLRHTFKLNTANSDKAARRAVEISSCLVAVGWPETLARFGGGTSPERIAAKKVTVGQYLNAADEVFDSKPKTFRLYATYFRRIISDIFGIDGGKARWDYRAGGRDAWVKRVNTVRLSAITPAKIQAWRVAFVKRASDPGARASASRTVNSYLRCARSLFSPKIVRFVSEKLELPDPLPFQGLKVERPRAPKYQGRIDVPLLITAAKNELRNSNPNAYVCFLLAIGAGLRKGEIDSLRWQQINFDRQTLRLEVSEHGDLKTDEAADEVEIDEALVTELRAHMPRRKGAFVIGSSRSPKMKLAGQYYRCQETFEALYAWLRGKGITDKKPLHVLRKEFGSIINQRHGLYAASAALRHRNISTTAGHYVAHKDRIMFDFRDLLTAPSIKPVPKRESAGAAA